jgi:radical SAM protein with 4Fe4S-binding SPASM domain
MDCGPQMELGSAAFVEALGARARRDRVPLTGAFDLTYRCNYRCVHCYVGHLAARTRSQAGELDARQAVDLLSQAADAGCLMLLLSGGEPLLRRDFIQIYTSARRLGLIVTVFTNASLVGPALLDAFAEFPPRMVEVSVYGASEAVYERITGIPGSYGRARQGIEQLLERGVRVGLKTMILRDNVEEIAAIEGLAKDLGLRFRLDPLITPRLDGGLEPLTQRVEARRAVDIELGTERRRTDLARLLVRQESDTGQGTIPNDRLYRCGAGVSSFHIDPRGVLRPCLVSLEYAYNASLVGFAAAWKGVTAAVDRATWDAAGKCANCPDLSLCGYCPGLFALEQASSSRPPEYLCSLGDSRRRIVSRVLD